VTAAVVRIIQEKSPGNDSRPKSGRRLETLEISLLASDVTNNTSK
jgi:hypothetical protein